MDDSVTFSKKHEVFNFIDRKEDKLVKSVPLTTHPLAVGKLQQWVSSPDLAQ